MGPHRIAMLRYGIPDIRLLYDGDMRFLGSSCRGRNGSREQVADERLPSLARGLPPPHRSTRSDLTERLAMLGAPVDAVEPLHADLGDIVRRPGGGGAAASRMPTGCGSAR